jgi:hypothetical protein
VRLDHLLAAVIARLDRGGHRPLRFVGAEGAGRSAAEGALEARRGGESLSAFFAYLSGRLDFDDSNLRADLGAALPRFPEPREYLPNLLAFCESTEWGKELPWKAQPCRTAA